MGQRHKRLFEADGIEFIGVADTTAEATALFEQIAAGKLSPDFKRKKRRNKCFI